MTTPYSPNPSSTPPYSYPLPESPVYFPSPPRRGGMIVAAVIHFVIALLTGLFLLFLSLLAISYAASDLLGALILLVGMAGLTTLHITLGFGLLKVRRWAIILNCVVSVLYGLGLLTLTIILIVGPRHLGLIVMFALLTVCAFALNALTLPSLKRTR